LYTGIDRSVTEQGIDSFIEKNSPLAGSVELHEAKFWNTCQSSFLKQVLDEDAEWVEVVNQLDVMLR